MSAVVDSLDKDVFATLTAEEQAAIKDHEYTPAELAAIKNIAGDAGADGNDDAGDDGGDADEVLDANGNPVAVEAKVDTPAAPAGDVTKPAEAADQDPAPVPQAQAAPVFVAKLPEDYQARVDALNDKATAIRQQFKDGEIDLDTFDAKNAELQTERDDLVVLRAKAEISKDMTAQSAEDAWRTTVNTFFSTVKTAGGPDYIADEARRNDLDMFVKALANDEKTADKPMSWFLTEAHKRVQALHGEAAPAPKPAPDAGKPKDALAEARAKRTPNLETAPRTLAQVPGADGPGDVGSEFAHLDALEGDALESAIARMSPAQREKYARGE